MFSDDMETVLDRMTGELKRILTESAIEEPAMVGIHTGGAWIASALHQRLGLTLPLGTLDISFYRDDFSRIGMHPQVKPSHLPYKVEDQHIILVDDVLYTGRTVRAALNEIFDFGRPASVILAVAVERDGRELPIQANVVGKHLKLRANEQVKLSGPTPLSLNVMTTDDV